jgi:hypothetical protein
MAGLRSFHDRKEEEEASAFPPLYFQCTHTHTFKLSCQVFDCGRVLISFFFRTRRSRPQGAEGVVSSAVVMSCVGVDV